jgi:hypothetical protein
VSEPDIIKNALEAVRGDDPELARDALMLALAEHPERLDLVHTLAIMELQKGTQRSRRSTASASTIADTGRCTRRTPTTR